MKWADAAGEQGDFEITGSGRAKDRDHVMGVR